MEEMVRGGAGKERVWLRGVRLQTEPGVSGNEEDGGQDLWPQA